MSELTYPHWVVPNKTVITRQANMYQNLNKQNIIQEHKNFYDTMVRTGKITPKSSYYNQYIRGWMACVNLRADDFFSEVKNEVV
jgi:hypothetical protein